MMLLVLQFEPLYSLLNINVVSMRYFNLIFVPVLNRGATNDSFYQKCLREICYLAVTNEIEVRAKHLSGVENRFPDLLSRWSLGKQLREQFWLEVTD